MVDVMTEPATQEGITESGTKGNKFRGIMTVPYTAFHEGTEEINEGRIREHIHFLADKGIHNILLLGSSGSYAYMSFEERKRIIDIVMDETPSHMPVVIGSTATRARDTVMMMQYAKNAGAAGVMVSATYYLITEEPELYHYWAEVNSVGIPVVIYNIPMATGHDMSASFLVKLARDFEYIQYVKESAADWRRYQQMITLQREDEEPALTPICGWEEYAFEVFAMGWEAWICGCSNIMPDECVRLYELMILEKDFEAGRELWLSRILPITQMLSGWVDGERLPYQYHTIAETALRALGRGLGPPRSPLYMAAVTPDHKKLIEKTLGDYGYL